MDKDKALQLLTQGNERFSSGTFEQYNFSTEKRISLANKGQHPYALIIGCSDSRVPPEIIFNSDLGELFVVRTAGNVVDSVCMGSIEYGAEHLHIPLIIVLGHEGCGAVQATVDGGHSCGCLNEILKKINISLEAVSDSDNLYIACENENIRNTIRQIKGNSVIAGLLEKGDVTVIGAKYGLRDGVVTFFDS